MPISEETSSVKLKYCRHVLLWAPLIAFPLMLNLRWLSMEWPATEPKWAAFVLLGLVLTVAGSLERYLTCRSKPRPSTEIGDDRLSKEGFLFLLFFVGLAIGVAYAANTGEALNRLAFWYAGGITFWSVRQTARIQASLPSRFQFFCTLAALILCLHFWYGFFVDFARPGFNKFIFFSLIGHFNYTADVLVMLIPFLAWTVLTARALSLRVSAGLCVVTSCFMLLTTGSLGGMGGILAGALAASLLGLARWLIQNRQRNNWVATPRNLIKWGLMALVIALGIKPAFEHIPKAYRDQLFVRAVWWSAPKTQSLSKDEAAPPLAPMWKAIIPLLGARTPMWASTAGMIAEHPWRGHGTGSYLYEYPAFQKRYPSFKDPETLGVKIKTNPHNIVLQIASENGLPMALLFMGLLAWLIYQTMRQAWREPSAFWLCGVWALWAATLDAQVNHVFFNPASLFMAATGFGLISGRLPCSVSKETSSPWTCRLWGSPLTPVLASLAGILITIHPMRWLVSEYYVAKAGQIDPAHTPNALPRQLMAWKTAVNWDPLNDKALFGLASLYFSSRQPDKAETYLADYLKISPHRSTALNMLATIRIEQKKLDEAAELLKRALELEPDAQSVRGNLGVVRQMKEKAAQPESTPAPHQLPTH